MERCMDAFKHPVGTVHLDVAGAGGGGKRRMVDPLVVIARTDRGFPREYDEGTRPRAAVASAVMVCVIRGRR